MKKSWFNYIRAILDLYSMPSIFSLFEQEFSKSERKELMNRSINSSAEVVWKSEIKSESSLKYVNPDSLKVGQSHPVWSTVRCNIMDNKSAQLKCKLLTGTYILQGNRTAFNQHALDPTCKLCTNAPETRQHFIAKCPAFDSERRELTESLPEISWYQVLRANV